MTISSRQLITLLAIAALACSACSSQVSIDTRQSTVGQNAETPRPSENTPDEVTEPPTAGEQHPEETLDEMTEPPITAEQPTEVIEDENTESINEIGEKVMNRWWYPETSITYGELSKALKDEGLVSEDFTDWEATPNLQVKDLQNDVEIFRMEVVRIEETNATFEVEFGKVNSDESTFTFLEFATNAGRWEMKAIIQNGT